MPEFSIGEFDSLVFKAYRGAGFSWGLAQEAGYAAAWMAIVGLPAADSFADLLQNIDGADYKALQPDTSDRQWCNAMGPCCPVIVGSALSDFGWTNGGQLNSGLVYSPLILTPFVSACARSAGVSLCLATGGSQLFVDADGQLRDYRVSDGSKSVATAEVTEWQAGVDAKPAATVARRTVVPQAALEVLETLAHRTYVPASEMSRAGAGAGLTDND